MPYNLVDKCHFHRGTFVSILEGLVHSSSLKMETACLSETLVQYLFTGADGMVSWETEIFICTAETLDSHSCTFFML